MRNLLIGGLILGIAICGAIFDVHQYLKIRQTRKELEQLRCAKLGERYYYTTTAPRIFVRTEDHSSQQDNPCKPKND